VISLTERLEKFLTSSGDMIYIPLIAGKYNASVDAWR
jgi:hypothetical protein